MMELSPYLRADRNNPDIEKPSPNRQQPDSVPDDDGVGSVESKRGAIKPEYSIDKKTKSEPEVSTPADIKEQSDRDDRPDYGF